MVKSTFKTSDVVIVMYSIDEQSSLDQCKFWIDSVRDAKDVPMILVGNKSDSKERRVVSTESGMSYAEEN